MDWKKVLIYGSFAAGAVLFFSGKRPAGVAVAAIGAATLATQQRQFACETAGAFPIVLTPAPGASDIASDATIVPFSPVPAD